MFSDYTWYIFPLVINVSYTFMTSAKKFKTCVLEHVRKARLINLNEWISDDYQNILYVTNLHLIYFFVFFFICPYLFSCFCHHGIFNRIQELDYQLSPSVWSKCGTPESVINHHVQWTAEGMVILSICSIGFDHNLEQKLVYCTRITWSILI